MISEKFLHYLWRNQIFDVSNLFFNKEILEIISQGNSNENNGPNFIDARIKIGEILFAGNVEINLFSSDWIKHGNNDIMLYNNVILHVVFEKDIAVYSVEGEEIPCIELKKRFCDYDLKKYQMYIADNMLTTCHNSINIVKEKIIHEWTDFLIMN